MVAKLLAVGKTIIKRTRRKPQTNPPMQFWIWLAFFIISSKALGFPIKHPVYTPIFFNSIN